MERHELRVTRRMNMEKRRSLDGFLFGGQTR